MSKFNRAYSIIATNRDTTFGRIASNISIKWTKKPTPYNPIPRANTESSCVGFALVTVANCKKKNPSYEKIVLAPLTHPSYSGWFSKHKDVYWTNRKQQPNEIYNTLEDDECIVCIVYGVWACNGRCGDDSPIDIIIDPFIGGKIEQKIGIDVFDSIMCETYKETGILISRSIFSEADTYCSEDYKLYFILKKENITICDHHICKSSLTCRC